jgi:hypothetical protein
MKDLRFPDAAARLDCVDGPVVPSTICPRPMPALRLACPAPRAGAAQRYRMPLWRLFEKLGD